MPHHDLFIALEAQVPMYIVGPWVIDSINLYRDLRTGTQYIGNWASRVEYHHPNPQHPNKGYFVPRARKCRVPFYSNGVIGYILRLYIRVMLQ